MNVKFLKGLVFLSILFLSFVFIQNTAEAETSNSTDDAVIEDTIIQPISVSVKDQQRLIELGFTEDEIEVFNQEEYAKYIGLNGTLLESSESVKEVVVNTLTGEIVSSEPIPKSEALAKIKLQEAAPEIAQTCSGQNNCWEQTSWMKLQTTASKLSNGRIFLKTSFTWLSRPAVRLTDVVAVTHSPSAVKIPSSDTFSYTYKDGVGTHSVAPKQIQRTGPGVAARFNLKDIGTNAAPYDHRGYITLQITRENNNITKGNAYGHYSHTTVGVATSVSIASNGVGISIGGVRTSSNMSNPVVLYYY